MDALGPRIKRLRQQAGLNKAALARLVGVSDVTISYWESGAIKQIGHERLVALACALGCPLSELLDDRPKPTPQILQLNATPPVPWLDKVRSPITLPQELFYASVGVEAECLLVTPAPDQHFDFLARGDLAAVSPTSTFQRVGLYVVEHRSKIQVRRLQQGPTGELQLTGESQAENDVTTADATLRLHGKIQARWRMQ
ncbi:helix-turn-helix domain-containing protein [Litchfieldella rifensis]|uniref:Helix-turn-helix domain-containing protein n=1 Tax=Litchfieldella rifensis TaxID=762643 RepID=A0ABV7LK34_9GAMM